MSRQAVPAPELIAFIAALFERLDLRVDAARTVAADLVAADLAGLASHGVMLVPLYLDRIRNGSVSLRASGTILSEKGGAVVLDAGHALGQLTARQAVEIAVSRAQMHGLAAVAVRNAFHFGAAGLYAKLIADAGCIGLVSANTRPLLPAPGGAEALVGNNPVAIAVPASGAEAVAIDMALSATSMGSIRLAAAAGRTIAPGLAVDAEGRATRDPATAIKGMLLPAAGPKGFGLAFMFDLLCGGLSGGATGADVRPLYGDPSKTYDSSQFFLAINVAHFRDLEDFGSVVETRAEQVRTARRAEGVDRLFAPGDRSKEMRLASGDICQIDPATTAALQRVAGELGVDASALLTPP